MAGVAGWLCIALQGVTDGGGFFTGYGDADLRNGYDACNTRMVEDCW